MFLQHIRDITDPEHPYSLEQLNVVEEDLITVQDESGYVKWVSSTSEVLNWTCVLACLNAAGTDALPDVQLLHDVVMQGTVHSDCAALQYGNTDWSLHTSQAASVFAAALQGMH